MGRNSIDIGAWGSGTTSPTNENVFTCIRLDGGGTVVNNWAEFLSCNATAEVRSGTAPSCEWELRYTSSDYGAGSGFATCQSVISILMVVLTT